MSCVTESGASLASPARSQEIFCRAALALKLILGKYHVTFVPFWCRDVKQVQNVASQSSCCWQVSSPVWFLCSLSVTAVCDSHSGDWEFGESEARAVGVPHSRTPTVQPQCCSQLFCALLKCTLLRALCSNPSTFSPAFWGEMRFFWLGRWTGISCGLSGAVGGWALQLAALTHCFFSPFASVPLEHLGDPRHASALENRVGRDPPCREEVDLIPEGRGQAPCLQKDDSPPCCLCLAKAPFWGEPCLCPPSS